jgi:hypothetical protein
LEMPSTYSLFFQLLLPFQHVLKPSRPLPG